MKHQLIRGLGVVALMLSAVNASANPVIYSQPADFAGFLASQNDPGGFGNFATTYDNFTLGQKSLITDVEWQGSFFQVNVQGSIHGPITAFTIAFWSNNSGQPGALLLSQSIPGTSNETYIPNGRSDYTYSTNLITPFLATAGTPYWISIVPDLVFPPQWAWDTGTGPDGISVQDFFGNRAFPLTDLAFSLTGVPVPEPASLVLLGTGLVAVVYRRRQQLKRS